MRDVCDVRPEKGLELTTEVTAAYFAEEPTPAPPAPATSSRISNDAFVEKAHRRGYIISTRKPAVSASMLILVVTYPRLPL